MWALRTVIVRALMPAMLLAVVLAASLSASARAAVQPCPTPPPELDATSSDEVAELRELRRELAAACDALGSRLDRDDESQTAIRGHLGDVTSGVEQLHDDLGGVLRVREQATGPSGPTGPTGSEDEPSWVRLAGQDGEQLYSTRFWVAFCAGLGLAAGCFQLIRRTWGL